MSDSLKLLQKKIFAQRKTESTRLSLKLAQEAELILRRQNVENEDAVFLLFAAANYLNAFVKQSDNKHFENNYFFKFDLVESLKKVDRNLVRLTKEDRVLMAEIKGFQFSFHHVNFKDLEQIEVLPQSKWAGIKLQPYATELFKYALELNDNSQAFVNQLKALADPMRLKILDILIDGERCACTFTSDLPISQSTLSHHLSVLNKAGLIKIEKEGVRSNVSVEKEAFKQIQENLSKFTH